MCPAQCNEIPDWTHLFCESIIQVNNVSITLCYPDPGLCNKGKWSLVMVWHDGRPSCVTSTVWSRRYSETLEEALEIANKIVVVELGDRTG
jgi:hypothetical protein